MVRNIKYENLTEQVYKVLLDMVINGELKPDERIVEESISKKLRISRTTLKRAINILIGEGIVEERPKKGCYLKSYSKKEILDIYYVREVIEGLSARIAAEIIKPHELKELKEIIKKSEEYLEQNDINSYNTMNTKFHELLTKISKNKMIISILGKYNIIRISLKIGETKVSKKSIEEHKSIIKAIESADGDMAEKIIRNHIRFAREELAVE